jgi:hypothetical protein
MAKKTTDNRARRKQILSEELEKALKKAGERLVKLIQDNLINNKYDFTPLSTKPPPKKSPGGYAYRKKRDGYGNRPILVRTGESLAGITFLYQKVGNEHILDIISEVYQAHAKGGGKNDLPIRDAIGSDINPIPGAKEIMTQMSREAGQAYQTRVIEEGLV